MSGLQKKNCSDIIIIQ